MTFKELLLETNKNSDIKHSVKESKISNFVSNLPRLLHHMNFKTDSNPYDIFLYGITDITYSSKVPESEIKQTCDIFKSTFQELFNLKAELKVELIYSEDNSYDDDDGCPHREYMFCYLITWFIVMV